MSILIIDYDFKLSNTPEKPTTGEFVRRNIYSIKCVNVCMSNEKKIKGGK